MIAGEAEAPLAALVEAARRRRGLASGARRRVGGAARAGAHLSRPSLPAPEPIGAAAARARTCTSSTTAARRRPATWRRAAAACTSAATARSRRSTAAASSRCRVEVCLADVAPADRGRSPAHHLRRSRLPERPHPRVARGPRAPRGVPGRDVRLHREDRAPPASPRAPARARARSAACSSSPRWSRCPTPCSGTWTRATSGPMCVEALSGGARRGHRVPADVGRLHARGPPSRTTASCSTSSRPRASIDHVDPVQYGLRLLVPPGSLLLDNAGMQPYLAGLVEAELSYRWRHPDPRMDALRGRGGARPGGAQPGRKTPRSPSSGCGPSPTPPRQGSRVPRAVRAAGSPRDRTRAPRLTEAWFC